MFQKIIITLTLAAALQACGNANYSQAGDESADGNAAIEEDSGSAKAGSGTISTTSISIGETSTVAEKNHSAYIWKGFEHEWLRTVFFFKIPHRISKFDSYINNENHQLEGGSWTGDATWTFGQSTGVDGNFMKPSGYYAAVNSPAIYTSRGNVHLTWTDDGDGGTYPKAKSKFVQTLSIDLDRDIMAYGNLDNYTAFLRGIKLDTSCPSGSTCNSDGMWPYKMYFKIDGCVKSGTNLNCTLTVEINRAWTPNKGGIQGVEEKPFSDKLDLDLRVYYTAIGGNDGDFDHTAISEFTRTGKGRDNDPKSGTKTVYGKSGYSLGTTAYTAFGFEFTKFGSLKKNNHLGRYIGSMYFRIKDGTYTSSSNKLTYNYYNQVWVPDTVVNTNVTYFTKTTLLQFGAVGTTLAAKKSTTGSLCINSTNSPWFSKWKKCGSGDKGPERSEHKVTIYAP